MIHIETDRVVGMPWYHFGRSVVAWTEDDLGERTYGPARWTRTGAERALIRELGRDR